MIQPTWNPFSRYADKLEKKVDKLLRKVVFLDVYSSQRELLALMQENLVIVNLWLEARFKGYKFLNRRRRKKLYQNNEKIALEFLDFLKSYKHNSLVIKNRIAELGVKYNSNSENDEKLKYLCAIINFLHPANNRFQYLEGSAFRKLLIDPMGDEKMIGDCNQIVTYYAFLYSLKYDLNDLKIKILPKHVCLHFEGIDIEATNGSFAYYQKDFKLLPIVELIATNMLDISDFRDKQKSIQARDFLKGAHLVYNISSDRELVSKNLQIAYQNVVVEALHKSEFETADFFLQKMGPTHPDYGKLKSALINNAVNYYCKNHFFKKARYYARQTSDNKYLKFIDESEANYNYNEGDLAKARYLYQSLNNEKMVKACYSKEYNTLQRKVANVRDIKQMKYYKHEYKKMLELAYKMDDQKLIDSLSKLITKL